MPGRNRRALEARRANREGLEWIGFAMSGHGQKSTVEGGTGTPQTRKMPLQKPQGPSPVRKQHPWQSSQEFQLELAQARWPDSTAFGGVQLVWLCVLGSQHVGDSFLVTNVKVNLSLLLASGRLKEMLLDGDTNSAQVPGRPKDHLLLETWASTLAGR